MPVFELLAILAMAFGLSFALCGGGLALGRLRQSEALGRSLVPAMVLLVAALGWLLLRGRLDVIGEDVPDVVLNHIWTPFGAFGSLDVMMASIAGIGLVALLWTAVIGRRGAGGAKGRASRSGAKAKGAKTAADPDGRGSVWAISLIGLAMCWLVPAFGRPSWSPLEDGLSSALIWGGGVVAFLITHGALRRRLEPSSGSEKSQVAVLFAGAMGVFGLALVADQSDLMALRNAILLWLVVCLGPLLWSWAGAVNPRPGLPALLAASMVLPAQLMIFSLPTALPACVVLLMCPFAVGPAHRAAMRLRRGKAGQAGAVTVVLSVIMAALPIAPALALALVGGGIPVAW